MSRATESIPANMDLQQMNQAEPKRQHPFIRSLKKHWELYLLVLPLYCIC